MRSQFDGAADVNGHEDCTTTGAAVVTAGTHTIDFEVFIVPATTSLGGASMWAQWVPFDGTGAVPTRSPPLGEPGDIPEGPTGE
jgi:hypothetical protein